ncbi:MAG TPA: chalcone isomerase family protein [Albitalea sp.]|uniref:chalcone isomerase family protein n=1 Tax=Piscinibacter sp. TaxID=1903157 RepID=UPI002ED5BD7F
MNRTLFTSISRVLMACLLLAIGSVHAARIEGQAFDDRIRLADTELHLNGLGLRAVAWIRGYAAGLYLPGKASTPAQVLAASGPKRIQLKMMLDVEAPEFIKAFDVGVRRNSSPAEQAALAERMAQFDRTIASIGAVHKGDVIDLDFLPAHGLVLSINGKPRGQPIPGEDLYAGILKIFIGELPVDKKLKAGLLGAQPA